MSTALYDEQLSVWTKYFSERCLGVKVNGSVLDYKSIIILPSVSLLLGCVKRKILSIEGVLAVIVILNESPRALMYHSLL